MRGTKTKHKGIYQRSPGVFEVVINYKDPLTNKWREKPATVHGSVDDARDAQATLRLKWKRGEVAASKGSVREAITEWLRMVTPAITENTAYNYDKTLGKWVYPKIGDIQLKDLTTKDLDDLYLDLLAHIAPATVKKLAGNISCALDQAVTWNWIVVNPAHRCRTIKLVKKRVKVPDYEPVAAFLDWISEQNAEYGRLFWLSFYLGNRRGETCALRYSDIDWAGSRILLDESVTEVVGHGLKSKEVKTEVPHWVGLSRDAMELLQEQVDFMRKRAEDSLVALSSMKDFYLWSDDIAGRSPWRPGRVTIAFRRYRKKYPKEIDVTLRKLRHLHATVLLSKGLSLPDVSSRLGHASVTTTSNFYIDNRSSNDGLAASILDSLKTEGTSGEVERH